MAEQDRDYRSGRKTSLATARVVPIFLTLIVAYVSYVITGPLSITYITRDARFGLRSGIAIPVTWFILLTPVCVSWVRLLYVVILDPGYIEQREVATEETLRTATPGLEEFYTREVFVCDQYGLPIWCRYCNNWKPDRAHHNQDVGRCTRKMDHFCPWVGGVVGERSYKFFLQFLIYSMLLCTYGTIVFAFFVHLDRSQAQWIVALGLTSFFLLFTVGMVINSLWMVFQNVTTIENIDLKSIGRRTYLAVRVPSPVAPSAIHSQSERSATEVSPPSSKGPSSHSPESLPQASRAQQADLARSAHWLRNITFPLTPQYDRPPLPAPETRTFAVLELPPAMNPWNLGSPWKNFRLVFGYRWYDWFLPFRFSPCCHQTSTISEYELGPQLEQFLNGIHFRGSTAMAMDGVERKKRRRHRNLEKGWKNGERPDGWYTFREARRVEKQSSTSLRSRDEKV